MTTLNESRCVRRETAVLYRSRALVVTLHPRHLVIQEKGRRDQFAVGYDAISDLAQKLRARQEGKL